MRSPRRWVVAILVVGCSGCCSRPSGPKAMVESFDAWLSAHVRQIVIVLCVLLGVFLIVRGVINS